MEFHRKIMKSHRNIMKFHRTSFFARDQRAFKLVPKSIKEEEWKGEGKRVRERDGEKERKNQRRPRVQLAVDTWSAVHRFMKSRAKECGRNSVWTPKGV